MNRFFVQKENIKDNKIIIEGEDVLHIQKVLRLRKGDYLTVCDGDKTDYYCRIDETDKGKVTVVPESVCQNLCEPHCRITLFQGLPKGDKMEQIIQKCVELGVHELVPVMTKRVVARGDKNVRWAKVAAEAAKQCGRGILPNVLPAISFAQAAELAPGFDLAIIPYEEEKNISLKSVLSAKSPDTAAVFIGPEGGFDIEEVKYAVECGIRPVTLGKRILRTETAGMSVISNILYQYEGEYCE